MRLGYLDENEQISDFNNIDLLSNCYQRYYNVSSSADKTYALHVFYDINTGYINKEEIVCRSKGENGNRSILTRQYNSNEKSLKDHKF